MAKYMFPFEGGEILLDSETGEIIRTDRKDKLGSNELALFRYLLEHSDLQDREVLLKNIFGDANADDILLRKLITGFRKKIDKEAIVNQRGRGYQLSAEWQEFRPQYTEQKARLNEATNAEVNGQNEKCLGILEQLAAEGYAPAENYLGVCLINGRICEKDRPRGHMLIAQAAEAGYPRACFNMGLYRWFGRHGMEQDLPEAVKWFAKAENAVVTDDSREDIGLAFYYLYMAYRDGKGTAKDSAKAAEYRRKAELCGVKKQESFGVDITD